MAMYYFHLMSDEVPSQPLEGFPPYEGLAKRSLFVIGADGVIRYRWVTDDALVLPDLDEPIAILEGLG